MFLTRLTIVMLVLAMSLFFGCSDSTDNDKASNYELIQPTVDEVLTAGKGAPISAETLHDNMDDYFVVSVRSYEHYQLGHIPGAINIPWRTIANDASLALLPTDKTEKIVIYCYTGHTGAVATTVLNALGYDVSNLKFGMCGWTKDATARVTTGYFSDDAANDFATETTVNTPDTYELADPDYVSSQDADEVMQQAALAYVADATIAPTISAQDLFDILNDGDTTNDPQILSVRNSDHYAIGHIPGAINIYWKDVGQEENLKKLDPDRDIVVYCYTGHTGGVATTALRLLGYKTKNLKHGICDWTKDAAVRVTTGYFSDDTAKDFAFNTGTTP